MYRRSVLPSEEALKRVGIPTFKMGKDTIITYRGVTMSLKAAVEAGLL
jgi:hypothetical protein